MEYYEDYIEEYEKLKKVRFETMSYSDAVFGSYTGWFSDHQRDGIFRMVDGQLHNTEGPAMYYSNRVSYFQNGLLHRVGGPSEIRNPKSWAYHEEGKLHRLDGPATFNGSDYPDFYDFEWYVGGRGIGFEVETWCNENNIDPLNMNDNETLLFTLFMSGLQ